MEYDFLEVDYDGKTASVVEVYNNGLQECVIYSPYSDDPIIDTFPTPLNMNSVINIIMQFLSWRASQRS
jgi:hypothetical protein